MIKYKVNGEYLDQFKLENFAISKAISKIGEIDLRHGDRSTSFDVPLTAKNIKILRYTPELNNYTTVNNFDAYDGQLIEDDAVISDGYYQVVKFSPTTKKASLRFYGGNSAWYALLKDRFINQEYTVDEGNTNPYTLEKFQCYRTWQNIQEQDNNYWTWYLHDNTNRDIDGTLGIYNIAFYSTEIFKNIFDSVGIKTKGTLFNDVLFTKEAISGGNSVDSIFRTDGLPYLFTREDKADTEPITSSFKTLVFNIGEFDSEWNGNEWTAGVGYGSVRFSVKINTQRVFDFNMGDLECRWVFNGTPQTPFTIGQTYAESGVVGDTINESWAESGVGYTDITFNNVSLGDTVSIQIRNINNTTSNEFFLRGKYLGGGVQDPFITIGRNSTIPLASASKLLPKIKQTDFVKDILFTYGVVSQYDVKTKTLTLDKFENISNNIPNAIDWSKKIDLSKDINVDYTKILKNYGKKSLIEYQEDDNDSQVQIENRFLDENLGNGVIDIDNDFLSDEKTIYKSPFAATKQKLQDLTNQNFSGVYVPYLPYFEISEDRPDQSIKPRKLIIEKNIAITQISTDAVNLLTVVDEIGNNQFIANVNYAFFAKTAASNNSLNSISLDSISDTFSFSSYRAYKTVSETLLERNYNLYIKILNNPFYVSLNLNLSSLDVQSVDFLTPIYLEYKYDSGYYYIDSIEQYKGDGSTTKVNLVKI